MLAIPTKYKGIEFRSRLEARWAVFFERLRLSYYYEYEGFQLKSGWYLPDFYLPKMDAWIEIKGQLPTEIEKAKVAELSEVTSKRAFIIIGEIRIPSHESLEDWTVIEIIGPYWDNFQAWCACPECGKIDIQFEGRGHRVRCDCKHQDDKGYNYMAPRIIQAYRAAIKYQFHKRSTSYSQEARSNEN